MFLAWSEEMGSVWLAQLIVPVCTGEGGRDEWNRAWLFLELQQGWSSPAGSCWCSFTALDLGAPCCVQPRRRGQLGMPSRKPSKSPLFSSLSSRKPRSLQQQGIERDAGLVS